MIVGRGPEEVALEPPVMVGITGTELWAAVTVTVGAVEFEPLETVTVTVDGGSTGTVEFEPPETVTVTVAGGL